MNNIELKSIKDIQEMNFYIPSYQRGYRWKERQVEQLIDDIDAFRQTETTPFYFLQVLSVAKDMKNNRFNVVDGQQRLTTLGLILGEINIEYAREADNALDNYFKDEAKKVIKDKLGEVNKARREEFCAKVKKCCKFLYYEVEESKELATFNELNSGKIPAKDSELVKCVMLTKGIDEPVNATNARAKEWDEIERMLNNDSFFSFITPQNTWREDDRMTVLFRYAGFCQAIEQEEVFPFLATIQEQLETKSRNTIWKMIYSAYYRLIEWYGDPLMYHAFGAFVHKRGKDKQIIPLTSKNDKNDKNDINDIKDMKGYLPKEDKDDFTNWGDGLFNYLLLSNMAFCWKRWPYRYDFEKHRQVDVWTMEHIFARNQKKLNENELSEWLGEDVSSEEFKRKFKEYQDACKERNGDEWLEEKLGNRYPKDEDNSIRNLALLPRDANSSLNNKLFDGKRQEVCKWANEGWKRYWVPPVTEAVFMKSPPGLEMTLPYWSEPDKEVYIKSIKNDIDNFINALEKSEKI